LLAVVLRLRPVLIRASRVLPSTPPLFQRVERHFFEGQLGGFSVSGIHLWPHTSHTATRIFIQPMRSLYSILSKVHIILYILGAGRDNMSSGHNAKASDAAQCFSESRKMPQIAGHQIVGGGRVGAFQETVVVGIGRHFKTPGRYDYVTTVMAEPQEGLGVFVQNVTVGELRDRA
jgi:hypothetical protein